MREAVVEVFRAVVAAPFEVDDDESRVATGYWKAVSIASTVDTGVASLNLKSTTCPAHLRHFAITNLPG